MSRNKNLPNRYSALRSSVEKHGQMLEQGVLGVEVDEGYPVIITSGETREDRHTLAEHAEKLSSDTSRSFLNAEIIRQPVTGVIEEIIIDPEVTSIAFLGDGTFSTFNMRHEDRAVESVSWYNLARMATHLKQGIVEFRACSKLESPKKETRVSLPAFIVADQTKIIGSVNQTFANHHGFEVFNNCMAPVYANQINTAEQLRRPVGFDDSEL